MYFSDAVDLEQHFWSTYLLRYLSFTQITGIVWIVGITIKIQIETGSKREMEYKIGQLFSQIFKYFWVISM
jgi:hypothetical protein